MNIANENSVVNGFVDLNNWQLIFVSGNDTKSYLQGQLTVNLNLLTDNQFLFSAHCDAKGKVLSNMLIFQVNNHIYYLERQSVTQMQIDELKKYAIFADIIVNKADNQLLGLLGEDAEKIGTHLGLLFPDANNKVSMANDIIIIRLEKPTVRFILIAPEACIRLLKMQLIKQEFTHFDEATWIIEDIEAGYPIIDKANALQFIPQAISLEKIAAISLDKGCYRGQEMVARATYRGANKRALFCLVGNSHLLPAAGEVLEMAIEKNWRETGRILAAATLPDKRIMVQAVLNQDISPSNKFRIKGDTTSLLSIRE